MVAGQSFGGVNGILRCLDTDLPVAQSAFLRFAFGVIFLLPSLPGVLGGAMIIGAISWLTWRDARAVMAPGLERTPH